MQFNDLMGKIKNTKGLEHSQVGEGQNQKAGKQIRQGAGGVTGVQGQNRQVRKNRKQNAGDMGDAQKRRLIEMVRG